MHSPTFRPNFTDLPGLRVAELTGALGPPLQAATSLWLVAWDAAPSEGVMAAWTMALSPGSLKRLDTIGPRRGRVRFAASHAALVGLRHTNSLSDGHWSLSHTRWWAAISVSRLPVGVDLEADAPRPLWQRAAVTRWPQDPPGNWSDFLDSWVRAEASFKAGAGTGACCSFAMLRLSGSSLAPDHRLAVAWGASGCDGNKAEPGDVRPLDTGCRSAYSGIG